MAAEKKLTNEAKSDTNHITLLPVFPWYLVFWVHWFLSSQTPTCSPSSSLTFNLSPPGHQLSPHPFRRVRLLVIIIAAVSHFLAPTSLLRPSLAIQNHLKSPLSFLFVPHRCPLLLSVLCFSPTTSLPLPPLPPLSLVSPSLCCQVCVSSGVWGFFRKTGPPLCLCPDVGGHREGHPCQSLRSNLYPLIP